MKATKWVNITMTERHTMKLIDRGIVIDDGRIIKTTRKMDIRGAITTISTTFDGRSRISEVAAVSRAPFQRLGNGRVLRFLLPCQVKRRMVVQHSGLSEGMIKRMKDQGKDWKTLILETCFLSPAKPVGSASL